MAQRLILDMALVGEPDLLILDEPTSGLDPNSAREIRSIIREKNARGATVGGRAGYGEAVGFFSLTDPTTNALNPSARTLSFTDPIPAASTRSRTPTGSPNPKGLLPATGTFR